MARPKLIVIDGWAEGVERAAKAAGSYTRLAQALGRNPAGVFRWKRVPAECCREIERIYGVPRSALRPDIFSEGE